MDGPVSTVLNPPRGFCYKRNADRALLEGEITQAVSLSIAVGVGYILALMARKKVRYVSVVAIMH